MAKKSAYTMLNMINRSLDILKIEMGMYQFEPVPVDLGNDPLQAVEIYVPS